jgi:hypothetical protein
VIVKQGELIPNKKINPQKLNDLISSISAKKLPKGHSRA